MIKQTENLKIFAFIYFSGPKNGWNPKLKIGKLFAENMT